MLCEPPAHSRQRLTCEPPAHAQPNFCVCFTWRGPVGISVSGAVRWTYTDTPAAMEAASGAPSPSGALEGVPVVVAPAPLPVDMDMEVVTPSPSRRRLRDDGVSPPSHSTASTTASRAADGPPAFPGSPEDISQPRVRRRLSFKQSPALVEESAVVLPNAEPSEASLAFWRTFVDMLADPESAVGRRRYWAFRHRLRTWLSIHAPEDDLLRQGDAFATMPRDIRTTFVQRFLNLAEAPDGVRQWAAEMWPLEVKSGRVAQQRSGGWLYAHGVMLTFNGEWGVLPSTLVPAGASCEELTNAVRVEPTATLLWQEFQAFVGTLIKHYPQAEWAASLELCTESWQSDRSVRLHCHCYLKNENKMWAKDSEMFHFRESVPYKSYGCPMQQKRQPRCYQGLYYLQCPKVGLVFSAGSKAPFVGYTVNGDWIMTLVVQDKMRVLDARTEMIRSGRGLVRRLGDLDKLLECRKEQEMSRRVALLQAGLSSSMRRFRVFPEIEAWRSSYEKEGLPRKKFLVLEGGSGLGKTEFVRALAGPSRTLELNCANCGSSPDLRQHCALTHKVVLFDEAPPSLVAANRKLFQAPCCWVDLGHSPTGRDVYRVFLNDSLLVVCSNGWSRQCMQQSMPPDDREWLVANSVHVVVAEPMFLPSDPALDPSEPTADGSE